MPDKDELDSIWDSYNNQALVSSVVALDHHDGVVGFGTLLIEAKIRGGRLGHIEDIVVSRSMRGNGLGLQIIARLQVMAAELGCYKVILNCDQHNVGFYEKCGLEASGVSMQRMLLGG